MAVVPTRMILTPAFDDTKRMTVQGSVAVNEQVRITVVGVNDITDPENPVIPSGLVLRVVSQCGRIEYARFPADLGDVWTASNADATCTLQLNTRALQGAFHQLCADATVEAAVNLENGTTNNLYGYGHTVIRNWIQNPLSPVAGSSQLQAEIDTLTTRIGTHQHDDGEASASFPHNNLAGRDVTGVHPTIEAGVANAATAASNAQASANTAGSNASMALGIAQAAKAVTDAIQDGGAFNAITRHMTDTDMKAILNQVITWLNARRHT